VRPDDPVNWAPRELDKLIADPTQALDVFDFEPVMKKNVPPAHFGYMATGVFCNVEIPLTHSSYSTARR
jgi:4-hydroxymandelate oxidase